MNEQLANNAFLRATLSFDMTGLEPVTFNDFIANALTEVSLFYGIIQNIMIG